MSSPRQYRYAFSSSARLIVLAGVLLAIALPRASAAPRQQPATMPGDAEVAKAWATINGLPAYFRITPAQRKRAEGLIAKLNDPNWSVRSKATTELSAMPPQVAPIVAEAAQSDTLEIRLRASKALVALQGAAASTTPEVSRVVDVMVAAKDKRLIDKLIEMLGHENIRLRREVVFALRRATGISMDFNPNDTPQKRAGEVGKWRDWWRTNRATFKYPKPSAIALLICNEPESKIVAITTDGTVLWTRTLTKAAQCAVGLRGGGIVIGLGSRPGHVIEYDRNGKSIWNTAALRLGAGPIADVQRLPNGNTLIARPHDSMLVEISKAGKTVWMHRGLSLPHSVQKLANGNLLVAEHGRGRVVEMDPKGKIVWQYAGLAQPTDAVMTPKGTVLICDKSNRRVIEVNRAGQIIWQRKCPAKPSAACRLPDGTTAITSPGEGAVIVGRDGKVVRALYKHNDAWGKIRLMPIGTPAVLPKPPKPPKRAVPRPVLFRGAQPVRR